MNDAKTISQLNEAVCGQVCWLVQMGHGSMLTIEFGEPYLIIAEPRMSPTLKRQRRLVTVRGHWHLLISSGTWHLSDDDGTFVDPLADSKEVVRRGLSVLDGQSLTSVIREGNQIRFKFDLGTTLTAEPVEDDNEWDILTFFESETAVWTARRQ